jgi:DivIVA domain-containing protein
MFLDEINLTTDEILSKEFKIDTRGYRPQEVDKFLDVIINDYNKFSSIIKKLEYEYKELSEENMRLKQEIRKHKDRLDILKENTGKEITNVDLLRRISQLEKIIFENEE